jgi:hypothetical protein
MDSATFIYRNRSDVGFYDASTREIRGGPDKVIVYINGVLCAMDREAKIIIPVSRWKLAEIGLACCLAALKGKAAAPRPPGLEPLVLPELPEEALPEPPPEVTDRQSSEAQWEHLLKELRDLAR